ncbi:hypothetical protein DFH09DRAFT_1372878 [Mycena vulgaris]|nr:hypothetical protein DFH09DRAFT_1372878 [Mycena vulgaris]
MTAAMDFTPSSSLSRRRICYFLLLVIVIANSRCIWTHTPRARPRHRMPGWIFCFDLKTDRIGCDVAAFHARLPDLFKKTQNLESLDYHHFPGLAMSAQIPSLLADHDRLCKFCVDGVMRRDARLWPADPETMLLGSHRMPTSATGDYVFSSLGLPAVERFELVVADITLSKPRAGPLDHYTILKEVSLDIRRCNAYDFITAIKLFEGLSPPSRDQR